MDKDLKKYLIILGAIALLYYIMSPYESCMREYSSQIKNQASRSNMCKEVSKW